MAALIGASDVSKISKKKKLAKSLTILLDVAAICSTVT